MIEIHSNPNCSSEKVRVTFWMPVTDGCDCLYLVGWFDESTESVFLMERNGDGKWSLTLELERGCEYQYRFRTLDGSWLTDPAPPASSHPIGGNTSFLLV